MLQCIGNDIRNEKQTSIEQENNSLTTCETVLFSISAAKLDAILELNSDHLKCTSLLYRLLETYNKTQ